ncbi:MAG: WD40 repeat domain-containing protein [Planctomycetaceae bacterium]|jgi:WD40 repeat protein|nr:WD40 repeat domain-containing protein [Planctomycetaceae bacterium]MBT6155814.1 WD40 repeat domain-containing protein [Planctomycetaceae bacterium]MBT6484944.1 WD40 repeat domain-containing protein [Planctomycetaceae bacterium]MBT6495423.1 WD40 repeat domain-containing protein [Planctomycetaceae bacterium]
MSNAINSDEPAPPALPEDAPLPIDARKTHVAAEFKHDFPLTTCRIDPTGRFVFAGAEDLNVYRWSLTEKKEGDKPVAKTTFAGHESWVRSMDFSPDGQWLYTGGYDDHIGIWRADDAQPKPVKMVEAHKGWVRWVRVSPDGQLLASCGNDNLVKVWKLPDFELVQQFEGHKRYPYAVDFHPDGKRIASFDLMGVLKEWDMETGKELRSMEAKFMWGFDLKFRADMGGARDLRFSPDGKTLAVAGLTEVTNAFAGVHKPMILLVDWDAGKHRQKLKVDSYKGMAWGVRFHPEGFLVAVGAPQGGASGALWFWKPGEEKPFHTVKLSHCGRAVDLTPDATKLTIAQFDGKLTVYQMTEKTAS